MAEFGLDTLVITADKAFDYVISTVGDLLPDAFTPAKLAEAKRRRQNIATHPLSIFRAGK